MTLDGRHLELGPSFGVSVHLELRRVDLKNHWCVYETVFVQVLNSGSFWPQLSPQALPGSNLANRIVLPQRQHVHPYSQPTRPSNEFSHMIAYPSMAQTQAYVPSALRQAYPERSRFHDARAGMNYNLSQYRSIDLMGGLPPSYNRPSAYGNFVESSSNIPGSFPRNLSPSLMGSGVGHDGRHSVYQDGNRFTPHQQVKIIPTSFSFLYVLVAMVVVMDILYH